VSENVATSLDDGVPFVVCHPESLEAKAIMDVTDAIIKRCEG
jgi:hypothetical protein